MKRCFIFGAAPCEKISFTPGADDLVIAADGGYGHLKRMGVAPDIIIGDFDSLETPPMDSIGSNIQTHPCEKDDTDMMLAIKYGLSKGYSRFFLYGGIGGRLDHTVANLQALAYLARRGARGVLMDEAACATVIREDVLTFDADMRGIVSIFALDERAEGVTSKGLKYPLIDATLTNSFPLGVSNAFTGAESVISVKKGSLLVIWTKYF